ncbi:hypothetical protein OIU76_020754 [Salix suchowensis]|nr:hypothetical protein OIU76_020754 [Salix suchowensis]
MEAELINAELVFFKLRIIRISLLMNPTMLILSHLHPCTHL